ncbi:aspartate aminotransferase family protein [uncultured Arcticibacterium sp.]|uniref:pyridoxal phosphate-dependent decarboxylase family protein n=1 Tax=uncultured Arcticibacterium sp. TaxID=2173042 RepID=UPI0030FC90B5
MTKIRKSSIEIDKEEFRKVGYELIDKISDFIEGINKRPVNPNEKPSQILSKLGNSRLPQNGMPVNDIIRKATDLLFNHSLLNGHPKFMGYITSSAAPIGALADLLAAAVNPNVGAHILSPMATEIEKQTIQWLAEFIGVSPNYGGILVSGGNMANFTAFLAARTAKAPKSVKEDGITDKLTIYCSEATHTWIEKAAILFGLGSKAVRWISTDHANRMDTEALETAILNDTINNYKPFIVVGTAGDVSTGVVDKLDKIAVICKNHNLWFHIDGAYGAPAAIIPEQQHLFEGISKADSIALDPHKWLYSPLEAGCTLVKNPQHLIDTFSSHPEYYNFSNPENEIAQNFYEYGLQNSRGFRALKVWMTLQQMGLSGYQKLIGEDIQLSKMLFDLANKENEIEAVSQNLSITTFRYTPSDNSQNEEYLNKLNEEILNQLQAGGELFLSNALVKEKYCLRACIVNFRTSEKDIKEIIEIVLKEGKIAHLKLAYT